MSRRRWRPLIGRLLAFGGVAALVTGLAAIVVRRGRESSAIVPPPVAPLTPVSFDPATPASLKPELVTYVVGYFAALALTLLAFALVHWHLAQPATALGIVFALALVQIVVHFRCFLHVTLRGSARDDLQLILFSTLIVALMVGGTLIVLFNLRMRMM